MGNEGRTELQPLPGVHGEHPHRRPARGCQTHNERPAKLEVIGPGLGAGVEQPLNLARCRVNPCQIGALKKVAPLTSDAKV